LGRLSDLALALAGKMNRGGHEADGWRAGYAATFQVNSPATRIHQHLRKAGIGGGA
jgi:hypothetical protein